MRECNGRNFKIAYFLVADGLSEESWVQKNYYFDGNYGNLEGVCADRFNPGTGSENVTGLVYNNIVLTSEGIYGEDAGYPEEIKAGDSFTHNFAFDIPDEFFCIVNDRIHEAKKIPVNKSKLRVVAAIIDSESSMALNADSSGYSGSGSGIDTVTIQDTVPVSTRYYDLTGRYIAAPQGGIYIRIDEYVGGNTKVTKEFVSQPK